MNKEEMKNKYSAFITEISEILGLGKPVDILKLCATTDLFFRPLEKRIEELEKKLKNKCVDTNCPVLSINKQNMKRVAELEQENAELKKTCEDLKEFYEKEYFEIADKTANERIKELEQNETEITVDDYSPYDENTWGKMHEEMFVPKNLVLDMLKEIYAYIENLKKENTELKKNYEDSLVACGVLKNKVELLSQPSPIESMQDALITTQKAQNEKQNADILTLKGLTERQRDQLTKAKICLEQLVSEITVGELEVDPNVLQQAEQFLNSEVENFVK